MYMIHVTSDEVGWGGVGVVIVCVLVCFLILLTFKTNDDNSVA